MSNSPQADNSDSGPQAGLPTAVIHKKILDAAREDPNASPVELSRLVSGASVELVERVLANYGDPAERLVDAAPQRTPTGSEEDPDEERTEGKDVPGTDDSDERTHEDGDSAGTRATQEAAHSGTSPKHRTAATDDVAGDADGSPRATDLTEAQLETLAAVAEHPQATQRELAEVLDVSCATVNRRVSAIDGLSWTDRQSFVESLFDTRTEARAADTTESSGNEGGFRRDRDELRMDRTGPFEDPELIRKILHACLESDHITEEEELDIIDGLVPRSSSRR